MPRLVLFGVIIVAAVIIYAIIDCIMSRPREVRSISKIAWLFTIALLPVLGALLWFLFGRPMSGPEPRTREPRHPTAPDDDPQFLRNLEIRRRQQEREADLKRREAELREREKQSGQKNDDESSA